MRKLRMDRYTLLYLKLITIKDLLYSTQNSAQCYVAAWMGGEFGGEWTQVFVWLSPFAVHLKLTELLVNQLCACLLSCFSHVSLSVTLWTAAHQAPLSLGFSGQ